MNIIGRKQEQILLMDCVNSGRPEFLAVYGRRRVGKTYLIREYFGRNFAFYVTGIADEKMKGQLRVFHESLKEYGCPDRKVPKDWLEAFSRLKALLRSERVRKDPASGRIVVFIDELPWLDTPRSDFKAALDWFWNSFASAEKEILLIVCGSATSWIINNLLSDRGGFHNRITRQLFLRPFHLSECEEYYKAAGIEFSRRQLFESYMIFGGIPYYMDCMDRRLSLAQNIEAVCFDENGQLHYEFSRLYSSLFRHSERHLAIIRMLAEKKCGMTRTELAKNKAIGDGEALTEALLELTQCGFIRKYQLYQKNKYGSLYQLIDPFTLFALTYMESGKRQSWIAVLGTPGYYAWSGYAFELLCLLHVDEIKKALGITGMESAYCAWRAGGSTGHPGAQIDLLIDRRDDVINLCEMKYSEAPYEITEKYEQELLRKVTVFRTETGTKKAIHLTMVTSSGLQKNMHSGIILNEITGDDLFS